LRRGFKTEAEATSQDLRREIGVGVHGPLDPLQLAAHLGIAVVRMDQLGTDAALIAAVRHLSGKGASDFSALTVCEGTRRLVVYNPAHAPTRRANDITHELSHVILGHAPQTQMFLGCRKWEGDDEEEADWLSGCILVPGPAALTIARNKVDVAVAAARLGVSVALLRMRLNLTGATRRVARAGARRW